MVVTETENGRRSTATEAEEESRVIELVLETFETRFEHRIGRPITIVYGSYRILPF
jgi:hypothetical protein